VSGYYLDLRQKAAAELRPRITGRGEINPPGPTATAQRALGLHERWLLGEDHALAGFLEETRLMRARALKDRDALLWPNDVDVPKYRQRGPQFSCMPQGQAASAFVRAFLATSDGRWAEAAVAAVQPLLANNGRLGLVTDTSAGPVLEEAATDPPSHILNGWIFALWGLWDVATALDNRAARSLFDQSARALSRMLVEYDVGWWTRYSLFPPLAPDLAKPFYHAIHVAQMYPLHAMTGSSVFAEAAERWKGYDRLTNRARAVAAKAPSVIRDSWLASNRERSCRRAGQDTVGERSQ
jgi:hypothetical protein